VTWNFSLNVGEVQLPQDDISENSDVFVGDRRDYCKQVEWVWHGFVFLD
jgi:hypothetical protein